MLNDLQWKSLMNLTTGSFGYLQLDYYTIPHVTENFNKIPYLLIFICLTSGLIFLVGLNKFSFWTLL